MTEILADHADKKIIYWNYLFHNCGLGRAYPTVQESREHKKVDSLLAIKYEKH